METAEGWTTNRARELRERLSLLGRPFVAGERLGVVLTVLFFFLAFLTYYLTRSSVFFTPPTSHFPFVPEQTYFKGFVHAADALLSGRLDIPNAADLRYLDWAFYKGKYYLVEPILPAVVLMPGVALWGVALNQTLASVVIGGITASAVYRLMRGLTDKVSVQVWLTILFVFGTIYWWAATDGSTSQFNQTLAVLFVFLAIHETLVAKRPFLAGVFLGAAHLCRLPIVLAFPFFVIMFADQWLPESDEKSLIKRVNLIPLLKLCTGLGVFVALGMVYNYLVFDTPLPSGMHYYKTDDPNDQYAVKIAAGLFKAEYIPNHFPRIFSALPIFRSGAPYVLPSWAGMAFWATTPAFLYAFFAGVTNKLVIRSGLALLAVAIALMFVINPVGRGLPIHVDFNPPFSLEYYPFALLVLLGLYVGFRNRLVLACWAAIIPIGLTHFTFGLTEGWPQFGYRFALDYYPFLFLLTWAAIGSKIKWHHMGLITLGIIVNLWGVVWIHQFQAHGYLGLEWVAWG
ncbi:MAG TPA: hypothetical protein VI729_01295 [Anaerolineales bacterium]|nr:hypothetical protein [Anaerolineales bacterium]